MYVAESINQSIATDCRMFQPRRPVSSLDKVLYALDKDLRGQSVLQSVAID